MRREDITVDLLRQLLRYEPETGKLFWRHRSPGMFTPTNNKTAEQLCRWWNGRFAGQEALTATGPENCRQGRVLSTPVYAHQVAWAMQTGAWPAHEVDHEDGDRSNNRFRNLRDVTHAENMKNKRLYKNGNGVIHGVAKHKTRGTWQAYITIDGKRQYIGTYACWGQAVNARKLYERDFHSNHGRAA